MASLFSSILPTHLKEKLGIRAKERDKSSGGGSGRKPLVAANVTTPKLTTELRSQVRMFNLFMKAVIQQIEV